MCVGEQHSAGRQPIEIGCFRLRVTAKTSNPVIQIIDGYEQNVWLVGCLGRAACQRKRNKQDVMKSNHVESCFKKV